MIYFEPGNVDRGGDAVHRRDTAVYRDTVRAGGEPDGRGIFRGALAQKEEQMKELKRDLLRAKFTRVMVEEDYKYNAPHNFEVRRVEDDALVCKIHFQEGPVHECGINGVNNEDLINMVAERLECFQRSPYACRENEIAITKLEEALLWLHKRTEGRVQRGIEGTSKL